MEENDFGLIFWTHLLVILFAYISPFLLSWWAVVILIATYYLQLKVVGTCILSKKQFGDKADFTWYYLKKIGLKTERKPFQIFTNFLIPIVTTLTAILWQVLLLHKPILF